MRIPIFKDGLSSCTCIELLLNTNENICLFHVLFIFPDDGINCADDFYSDTYIDPKGNSSLIQQLLLFSNGTYKDISNDDLLFCCSREELRILQ